MWRSFSSCHYHSFLCTILKIQVMKPPQMESNQTAMKKTNSLAKNIKKKKTKQKTLTPKQEEVVRIPKDNNEEVSIIKNLHISLRKGKRLR